MECGVVVSKKTYFDVRIFNPYAKTNMETSLKETYHRQENDKRRLYEQRIIDIEYSSFVPLIFSATGGMSKITSSFYRHLAEKLSERHDKLFRYNGSLEMSSQFHFVDSAISATLDILILFQTRS